MIDERTLQERVRDSFMEASRLLEEHGYASRLNGPRVDEKGPMDLHTALEHAFKRYINPGPTPEEELLNRALQAVVPPEERHHSAHWGAYQAKDKAEAQQWLAKAAKLAMTMEV